MEPLLEVDSVNVTVIVDNVTDMMSPACACCDATARSADQIGCCSYTSEASWAVSRVKDGSAPEMDFRSMCYAGHGLSLLIEVEAEGRNQCLLFDAGPDGRLWTHNVRCLHINTASIDAVVLSHWHVDHSCGLAGALQAITSARAGAAQLAESASPAPVPWDGPGSGQGSAQEGHPAQAPPCVVDVHPARPHCRGLQLHDGTIIPFNQDPSWDQLKLPGVELQLHDQPHTLLGGYVYVSGFIPRVTSYEEGNPMHATQKEEGGPWEPDPDIADERFLMVKVKGKGPVVLSACSHAGIVNVVKAATAAAGVPLCCIMGGFHLAPRDCIPRIEPTVRDLVGIAPQACIIPAHCTGWRANCALKEVVAPGHYMPCSVGSRFTFSGQCRA